MLRSHLNSLQRLGGLRSEDKYRKDKRAEKANTLWGKKESRKKLESQCDMFCKILAFRRDKWITDGKCRICLVRLSTLPYHILPRGKKAIRWYLPNIVPGCSPCNAGEHWHRLDYADKHLNIFGKAYMDDLWDKSRIPTKFGMTELIELRDKLKSLVESRASII